MANKLLLIVFLMTIYPTGFLLAQNISGIVRDEHDKPFQGVNISIRSLGKYAISNQKGEYTLYKLSSGVYDVEFSMIGYKTTILPITISKNDTICNVILQPSPLEFRSVTVTADPIPTDVLDTPSPVSVAEGRQLEQTRGQSIMQSIESLPGVALSSNGPLSMKPVIRGLGAQRVVVAENGLRHQSQQWDDDQTPEIDPLDINRIEVLRGPNSVLFGSDALGGVINIISVDPRSMNDFSNTLAGNLIVNAFSNNKQGAGGFSLAGKNTDVGYKAQLDFRHSDNISTPAGELRNTGESELNGKTMLGVDKEWGSLALEYSHFGQHFQILPDPDSPPDATPYQDVSHDNIALNFNRAVLSLRTESHLLYQQDEETEFDEANSPTSKVDLKLQTLTWDLKAHHNPIGPFFGTFGFSAENQNNYTLGVEPLIPGFNQFNAAAFLHEEIILSPIKFSAGIRYDNRKLHVNTNPELDVTDQTRTYQALTGAIGGVYHINDQFVIASNLGRGWRAPIAEELFVNGVDQGGMRYKTGNPDLNAESSLNLDLSLRYVSPRFKGEISVFRNTISDYIYLSSTGLRDSASGLIKYRTIQSNAILTGSEFSVESAITDNLNFDCGIDFVQGKNDETRAWLPSVPPGRLKIDLQFHRPGTLFFNELYISLHSKVVANQNRVSDFETPTGGYTLFGMGFGGEITHKPSSINVDCSIENLFNRAYADHLSRYKNYALNPGRNLIFKISAPFEIIE
ncbi:MAG: TonB-dependent receptor [Bacteroidota bacterium]